MEFEPAEHAAPLATSLPDALDLDGWIDGTCGLTHTATIYQRGDLLATIDQLEAELAKAEKVPKEQRGVADRTPEVIRGEWEQVAEQLSTSAMVVHVQDRTEARRRDIANRLKKDGLDPEHNRDDEETVLLHQLADAIIKIELPGGKVTDLPEGFPPNKLRAIKDRLGDAGLYDALAAFRKVVSEAPTVAAPLSRRNSYGRSGVT